MSGEKSEKASEQRKKKSKERGEGVRSRELTSAAAMLCGLMLLPGAATQFLRAWTTTYMAALHNGMRDYTSSDALARALPSMLLPGTAPVAVVLAAAFVAAVAIGAMQAGGIQVRPNALAWKPSRLSPLANSKNLFSARSLLRLLKSLLPAGVIVALATFALRGTVLPMPVTSYQRLPATLAAAYQLALTAAWISLGWAAVDYVNEWRTWNSGLKMTKQEVREEVKESNGNPHTKGRIRQIQRAMRKRRVKADVARAAVVITNPTHYAVALLFDYETMGAPKVLTKGRDLHALDIREQARWAGVPIVENPPLARSLYKSVEEGQAIPYELYAAVAAILAFLFREAQQRAAQSARTHNRYSYAAQGPGYANAEPPRVTLPLADFSQGGESNTGTTE